MDQSSNEFKNLKLLSNLIADFEKCNRQILKIEKLSNPELESLISSLKSIKERIHSESSTDVSLELIVMSVYFFQLVSDNLKFAQEIYSSVLK